MTILTAANSSSPSRSGRNRPAPRQTELWLKRRNVAKWKQRETVADLPIYPKQAIDWPSITEEAIIIAIRLPCGRCSPNGFHPAARATHRGEIT